LQICNAKTTFRLKLQPDTRRSLQSKVTRVTSSSTVLINDDFLFHVIKTSSSYDLKKNRDKGREVGGGQVDISVMVSSGKGLAGAGRD
jgi:hypothetical protein